AMEVRGATVAQATLYGLAPDIEVSPPALTSTQGMDTVVTQTLTISNSGDADLNWTIVEQAGASWRERGSGLGASLGGITAYSIEHLSATFVSFTLEEPGTLNTISGTNPLDYWVAGDFLNGDFSTLYAVDLVNGKFSRFDTTSGAETVIATVPPGGDLHTWHGMAYDPTDGTLYASSSNCFSSATLYTLDPETGAADEIGSTTDATCITGIAVNPQGDMYGLDMGSDNLLQIDKATGAVTAIGYVGFDSLFSQGMDFDERTGILYLAAFNAANYNAELRVADLTTGNTTLIATIGQPVGTHLGTMAITTTGCPSEDISWLSAVPASGATEPGGADMVAVVFDSSGLTPGTYTGQLCVSSDDPDEPLVDVPITLIVEEITAISLDAITTQGRSLLPAYLALGALALAATASLLRRRAQPRSG
ncbi:MAG: hypothetical protein ACRDIB_14340, partial [Ardenticatenaceae bacterium]